MTDELPKYEADPDVVKDRKPASCPFCGQDGVFDGQGHWEDEITEIRASVETTYDVVWYQHRCPECNGHFQMIVDSEKRSAGVVQR